VHGLGIRVTGLGFRVQLSGIRVRGLRVDNLGIRSLS
jgi:hypothetical protein